MSRVKLTAFRVSLLSTLCLLVLYAAVAPSTLMRNLEAKALDLRFHLRGETAPDTPVVLVVVDDRSIAELGRWPWSRQRFADMVRYLHAAKAKVIGLDLLFAEVEDGDDGELLRRLRRTIDALAQPLQQPVRDALAQVLQQTAQAHDPDVALATAIREAGNVVLAFAVTTGPPSPVEPPARMAPAFLSRFAFPMSSALGSPSPLLPLIGAGLLLPIDNLGQSAAALGHVNVVFDTDGTPRYEYPVAVYAGEYYPSFAVQIVRQYLGLPMQEVHVHFGEGIQLGSIFMPTDESTRMLVNYAGRRGTFATYAFVDVLHGHLPDTFFKDAIVLVGGAASGLADTFVTPFSASLAGVERHATIVDNILRQDFLQRRGTTVLLDVAAIVIMGLLVGWLSPKCPSYWGSIVALGLAGLYATANVLAFSRAGIWVYLLLPLAAPIVSQSAITLFQYLTEERQKRLIRRAFQYYLQPTVVEQIAQHPHLLKLGGESRELTVLFSDIRRFSMIAERLSPEALVHLLNEYFTVMTRVIFRHNGLLDKYIGDGIMAVFGAPLDDPDHAYRACCSALEMLEELRGLQARWASEQLPLLNIGIGINTALMVVGNMGSELRFDYTVMGDGVNLAARLEGANKEYGTNIIISQSTWEQVSGRLASRELDIVRVKGKAQSTRLFEVLGIPPLSPDRLAIIEPFQAGRQAYGERRWEDAVQHFQQALEAVPGDPPSQLYIQRCKSFMATPPSEWDGVWTLQS